MVTGSSPTPCGATGGSLCREVPDVSASSDPNQGYAIYYSPNDGVHLSGFYIFGGTSAAAPTWAALLALIDANTACSGHRIGFVNPALYQLGRKRSSDFHDVTTGNNDAISAHGGTFAAAAGYDMATGLGTPVGAALRSDFCPAAASDGSGTMTVNPKKVGAANQDTLQLTYTAPGGSGLSNGEVTV